MCGETKFCVGETTLVGGCFASVGEGDEFGSGGGDCANQKNSEVRGRISTPTSKNNFLSMAAESNLVGSNLEREVHESFTIHCQ